MWYSSDTREVLYPNVLFYSGIRLRVFPVASDLLGDIIEAGGDSPCLCGPSFIVLTSVYEGYLYLGCISSFCAFKAGYDEPHGASSNLI